MTAWNEPAIQRWRVRQELLITDTIAAKGLNISNDDPVTLWIDELRNADSATATKLWNHFVSRLYEAARNRLRPVTRTTYNEEDAAQSAFNSVCAGIIAGRFPDLHDRDGLWRLMLTITSRKVSHQHRHDQQKRRDVRRNRTDLCFVDSAQSAAQFGMDGVLSREPSPQFAAEFVETCDVLYQSLDDPELQNVVNLRMEGCTDTEVAKRLNCSRRTV